MITISLDTSATVASRMARDCLLLRRVLRGVERNTIAALSAAALSALSIVVVLAQQAAPEPQHGAPVTVPAPAPSAPSSPATPPPASSPEMASWQKALLARLARFQRYPSQAQGAGGVVSVGFTLDRRGNVVSSRIIKSSGSAILDAEALALLKRASPLPPPPMGVSDDKLSFVVPIRFASSDKS